MVETLLGKSADFTGFSIHRSPNPKTDPMVLGLIWNRSHCRHIINGGDGKRRNLVHVHSVWSKLSKLRFGTCRSFKLDSVGVSSQTSGDTGEKFCVLDFIFSS
jgi:hypothetical protein